ncbi:nuclear transport factor 2 family protein [Hydrogenophaga sp. UC242_50]|uniref:nuclear transport factor 2 family protein n=1 Tax=unclassified Hydrogenophaga TaxID=2610897 RepID=UPI0036D268BB
MSILHFLGGSAIEVAGDRAIAQTKMTISQRGMVDGANGPVMCDVVCTGRFYDFVVREKGEWKLLHRQPIYEKDRIDPIDSTAVLALDQESLARMPEGYRHLAYIQTRIGYTVKMDMPMLKGLEVDELYRRGARWLAGGELEREVNPG